jgi:hypothetical protein
MPIIFDSHSIARSGAPTLTSMRFGISDARTSVRQRTVALVKYGELPYKLSQENDHAIRP